METVDNSLIFEVTDGIALITINRPKVRNSFTLAMYERLRSLCQTMDADPSVKAAVIAGAGGEAFSSGTDIAVFGDFSSPEDALGYETFMEELFEALERCRVPLVAAIGGACTGGAAIIAACCDVRIAAAHAKFGFPIARTLGNCLSVRNLARMASLIGPQRVKELIFTARLMGAEEAAAVGFVNQVVADAATLQQESLALAQKIASHAPLTLRATKEGLRRLAAGEGAPSDEDLILMCYMSEDFREGMDAFLNKRPAKWRAK